MKVAVTLDRADEEDGDDRLPRETRAESGRIQCRANEVDEEGVGEEDAAGQCGQRGGRRPSSVRVAVPLRAASADPTTS